MDKNIEVIARAIIADETKTRLLFCASRDAAYFYLPGGHVEFGEKAETALIRELFEETGADASGAEFRFAGAEENIFTQNDKPHHEINAYFEVGGVFSGNEEIPSVEDELTFHWLAIADIPQLPVLPEKNKSFLSDWESGKQVHWE